MMEGACPDCSGAITTTIHVCGEHDYRDGSLCERCGTMFEIRSFYVCDVCKNSYVSPVYRAIFTEVAVKAFFYEHGLDPEELIDAFAWEVLHDAIADVAVKTAEPLEIGVTVDLDGDRLDVTLDDDAQVIDVTEFAR